MGPLIPLDIIPLEWNNVFALLIGIAFGFILEASGFSSSRKLAGVFYGYDFAVLRVFFTAAIVALVGLLYLGYFGFIDLSMLYIHPLYLKAALIGGAIMGVGFVSAGFCPGTGLCAVAIGKKDAFVYVIGIWIGIFIFSEMYSIMEPIYNGSFFGNITLIESLGGSPYTYAFGLAVIAVVIFAITSLIRRKSKKVFY